METEEKELDDISEDGLALDIPGLLGDEADDESIIDGGLSKEDEY